MSKDSWDSEQYKKNSSVQEELALNFINNYKFNGNEKVLDIGCGDGRLSAKIAKKVPNGFVIGIDLSENMINGAKINHSNVVNLSFELSDALKFKSDKKFDLIVSFSSFHWIEDKLNTLKNLFNLLTPNGKLIIRMAGGNITEIEETLNKEPWKSLCEAKNSWHPESKENITKILDKIGFKQLDIKLICLSHNFKNKEELLNWLMGWLPSIIGISAKESFACAEEIIKTFCSRQEKSDSHLEIKWPILFIEAVK